MNPEMQTEVFGKWILAGEHAVLRGCAALVFPLYAKSLKLRFFRNDEPLTAEFSGEHGGELRLLFWGVIERALSAIDRPRDGVRGRIEIESSIPIGAGLGASAALCVAVTRWLAWSGWLADSDLYEFARQLENLFHGESSGVDIAVALSGKGLHFERAGFRADVEPSWQPMWYLSYSGKRGVTSECVARVKALWETDPALARTLDHEMALAVQEAERALAASNESWGFELLATSIERARVCFERWGLAGGEAGSHIRDLLKSGAVAAKPTGSGDGGFVLSLWRSWPPAEFAKRLIAINAQG